MRIQISDPDHGPIHPVLRNPDHSPLFRPNGQNGVHNLPIQLRHIFLNTHRHRPIPYRGNGSFHRVSGGHQAPRVVRHSAICRTHATTGVVTKGRVKMRLRPFLRSPRNGLIRPNSYRPAMCLLHRPADSVSVSGQAHSE